MKCPRCKHPIEIIRETSWDTFYSYMYPLCRNCGWITKPVFNNEAQIEAYLEDWDYLKKDSKYELFVGAGGMNYEKQSPTPIPYNCILPVKQEEESKVIPNTLEDQLLTLLKQRGEIMTNYVLVPEEQFIRILRDYNKYQALINGNVAEWEGFSEALYNYLDEQVREKGLDNLEYDFGYNDLTKELLKEFLSFNYE